MSFNRNTRVTGPSKYFATWKRYLAGKVAVSASRGIQSKYVPVFSSDPPHILSGSDRRSGREMNLKRVCG